MIMTFFPVIFFFLSVLIIAPFQERLTRNRLCPTALRSDCRRRGRRYHNLLRPRRRREVEGLVATGRSEGGGEDTVTGYEVGRDAVVLKLIQFAAGEGHGDRAQGRGAVDAQDAQGLGFPRCDRCRKVEGREDPAVEA